MDGRDEMEEFWADVEWRQYRETTNRLLTSDPDEGLGCEVDQDGNVRTD